MNYVVLYDSPLGTIILESDGEFLTGLWFKDENTQININNENSNLTVFIETKKWLDIYFKGGNPNFIPKYKINGITPFRQRVIDIMLDIPFGKTITYNDIAKKIAQERGIPKMSAQAVGGAVGWNPICIIIPCHRVMGANGNLTGYGGGIQNKYNLLKHEKIDTSEMFFVIKNGSDQ